ncbi:MAG: hypothetical protein A2941_02980 [Candidatus Yanofskybacteria bacterium RIFCSPLOWO2_01_FULL_49_17]|uniref:HEPN domain-containing protein n=1 Tax=Candidatus Yanofskybacteria bacterium RIFCSPLOWO2_01_FULL_49_17 TaxID=1802700 RepID=A0A1F8GTK6_9BACT|nr:MAG: hypothetical protein A2941_02980 [Candidatus Yanofskybacteria bacterium RIFCSPLOWO2_01_FULL_49_17]
MNKNKDICLEWVAKADEDLRSLESLLKHKEGSPSTGCFLAQQAVEKLFKSLLVLHGAELEKVHDLIVLLNKIKIYQPEIERFLDKILVLTRYYIETRYPGDYPEFTWEECKRAFNTAAEIVEFVKESVFKFA